MPAHQTLLSAKNALPFPLAPPYYVNRTDAWQARVMEAARSYFRPAEFADLQRLEIRFVPQEAERIKRHLRRRGDYKETSGPADIRHPARAQGNTDRRDNDIDFTNDLIDDGMAGGPLAVQQQRGYAQRVAPDINEATGMVTYVTPNDGAVPPAWGDPMAANIDDEYVADGNNIPGGPAYVAGTGTRLARKESLLRRTQLFIASIFVFDQAHALLRHLREECLSLTSAGTDADENLLKQIVRNVRGFTFRKLKELPMLPAGDARVRAAVAAAPGVDAMPAVAWDTAAAEADRSFDLNWVAAMQTPISRAPAAGGANVMNRFHADPIQVTTGSGSNKLYCPTALRSYKDFQDFYEPFSQSELDLLKNKGYIRRNDQYYCPHRLPEWMARLVNADDSELYTINGGPSQKFGRLRNQMVYPVTYLTNGQIADDTLAARLIEHVNARVINPEYFSWGVRRHVFLPLEVDIFDITRFDDMELYDSLHETLNAFSTGIFEGMNLDDLWPVVRRKYQKLPRQVPRNMLKPFDNVCKKIILPSSSTGGGQRNFANEEVLRLFMAADDCIRIIGKWYQQAGFMNKIDFSNYRQAAASEDTTVWEATIGNRPDVGRYGMNAYGADECGPGMKTLYYTADPNVYPNEARLVTDPLQIDPLTGKMYKESRLVSQCVPLMDADRIIRAAGGDQVETDMVMVGEPRGGPLAVYGE